MPQQEKKLNPYDFNLLIRGLRVPSEANAVLFEDVAQKLWSLFQFKKPFDLYDFEAFLIETICLKLSISDINMCSKDTADKFDMLLLMFGLLKGYYHTEVIRGIPTHLSVEKRKDLYLRYGDYIKFKQLQTPEEPFDKLFASARGRYIQAENRALKVVAGTYASSIYHIYTEENGQAVMDAGIKHFITEDGNGRRVNYPKPIFTLENFPIEPKTTALEEKAADQEAPMNVAEDIGETVPIKQKKINIANWLSILCAALCVICLLTIPVVNSILTDDGQIIQDIDVAQSQITLYPGGSERLQIYTAPEDADMDGLECHSDSNPLITADKSNDWGDTNPWTEAWKVAAEKDWTEIFPYNAKVSVMGGDAIPVYVDITVEQPSYIENTNVLTGNNADDGTGEKTDDTP